MHMNGNLKRPRQETAAQSQYADDFICQALFNYESVPGIFDVSEIQ